LAQGELKGVVRFFFKKLADEFNEITFSAASLAYSTLFSLIPFLIVTLSFFQSFGVFDSMYPKIESLVFESMKEATGVTVTKYIRNTIANVQFKTVGWTGVIFLVISSISLLKSIDVAFHKLWHIKMKKSFWKRTGLYWTLLLGAPVVLLILSSLKSVDLFQLTSSGGKSGSDFLFFIYGSVILWVIYTFIPEIKVNFLCSAIAAVVASFCLAVVQDSFLWFALKLFKQNKIYGSLASFPIFLLWLLVIWYVILSGVSLCAFLQQKIFKRS
jgi:membrane protein